jgi:FkbM family methyltransferase
MKKYLAQTVVNIVSNAMSLLTRLPIVGNRIKRDFVPKAIQSMEFHYPSTFPINSLLGLVVNDKSFYRLQNLANKEPETIEFLSKMSSKDILWDIGANIGQITLPIGKVTGASIFCFEPDPGNFFILANNVFLNGLSSSVQIFNLALNDTNTIVTLPFEEKNVGFALAGRSCLSVSEETNTDNQGLKYPALTGDIFVDTFEVSMPTYIKLDVDGNELKILKGLDKVLSSGSVKAIIVEAVFSGSDANSEDITELLLTYGYVRSKGEEAPHDSVIKNMVFHYQIND